MVKLQGIKTLPYDKNFPDYEKYSNKALRKEALTDSKNALLLLIVLKS